MSKNNTESFIAPRIRINISSKAFHIIKSDESCFSNIFRKCKDKKISDRITNALINNMDLSEIEIPTERKIKHEGNVPVLIKFDAKLNKDAVNNLNLYSIKNKGTFVSRLLEAYAEKPYYLREQIYFSNFIKKITNVNTCENLISVRYRDNENAMLIYPHDIRTDEWSSYNYLIGVDITNACSEAEERLVNLRISYISHLKVVKIKDPYPQCRYSAAEIEERIDASGIQFVASEPVKIRVKLPSGRGKGKDMYDHMVFMRPPISEMPENDDIYTFYCTEAQARFYFFKFGAEIEIIEPESLRKEFLNLYGQAYKLYKNE